MEETLSKLAEVCKQHLLDEKWLLARSRRAANQWKQRLVLAGVASVNLQPMTLESAVRRLLDADLRGGGESYADPQTCQFLLQGVLHRLHRAGRLKFFAEIEKLGSLQSMLSKTIMDLRLAAVTTEQFAKGSFDNPDRAHDLLQIFTGFEAELGRHGLVDYPGGVRRLLAAKSGPPPAWTALVDASLAEHDVELKLLDRWRSTGRLVECRDEEEDALPAVDDSRCLKVVMAEGEVNEIQGVFRDVLYEKPGRRLDDVELLYSSYESYAPLVHNFLLSVMDDVALEDLPVTFAEGIATVYSRPGRALRAWVRWLISDCPQSHLVHMIREGLVDLRNEEVGYGYARAAAALRRLPIGIGRQRFIEQLERAVNTAQSKAAAEQQHPEALDDAQERGGGDYGLEILSQLKDWVGRLLDVSPDSQSDARTILAMAKLFLEGFARTTSKLDSHALALLQDQVGQVQRLLQLAPDVEFDAWSWLEELPLTARVMSSGPQPGCLHVDSIGSGGQSGRPHLMVVGLDDSHLAHRQFQDPLLLDDERLNVSAALKLSHQRRDQETRRFLKLFTNSYDSVTLCYSTHSLQEDRKLFPSSMFLQAYRMMAGLDSISEDELQSVAAAPVGFLPQDGKFLSINGRAASALIAETDIEQRVSQFEAAYPHWAEGRTWLQASQDTSRLGEADGWVPAAGPILDPTAADGRSVSASALESYGVCPRRYFFRRGLRIQPPDELVLDDDRWLDPLTYGALVHSVFELFMIELTQQKLAPDFARHLPRLIEILQDQLQAVEKENPVRHATARQRQEDDLIKTCEIFLREEEAYCRRTGATPLVMEASIGLGQVRDDPISCEDPVRLSLADGREFYALGVMDRVDASGSSDDRKFSIWDYKSGSDWGYEPSDPLQKGRKLQPYLYAAILKHRLSAAQVQGQVEYFGYFFPGPRTNGRRIQWRIAELKSGDAILDAIFTAIQNGVFLATTNEDDCKYCDYLDICGDPKTTAELARRKLQVVNDDRLNGYRTLLGISQEEPF